MSKKTTSSLFMLPPLAAKYGRFYQELLRGVGGYQQLGNRLIQLAEQAHAFRQFDEVKEIGQLLSNIPIKGYQAIGYYFLAVAANSRGNGDQDEAHRLYGLAADTAPSEYRAKAILSLGAVSFNTGHLEDAFYYYREAIKAGRLSVIGMQAIRGMALLKSVEGYHRHALNDLESLLPIAKYAQPHIYSDYLNSYAVELGESGRLYEARNISHLVLASPFAPAYPEWQETANELKEANRSFVAVSAIQDEHAEPEKPIGYLETEPQARVYLFPHRKEESPELPIPEPITSDELENMSLPELKAMLLSLAYDKDASKDDYRRMLMASKFVQKEEGAKEIDLESDSNLEQIIIHWLNEETSPEQLTAVFSALRDCDSEFRRKSIMDRIIAIAYKESMSGQESESEWREQFEAKLTPNPYKIN